MSANNSFTLLTFAIALALTGCGGSSSGGGSASTAPSLSGTAATGAAISAGTVIAKCTDGSGFQSSVTTNSQGKWSGTLTDASVLPCALEVTFGNPEQKLHSFASAVGTINITPLTDLTLAQALADDPSNWFASADPFAAIDAADITTAGDQFLSALVSKNYKKPASGNPFTTAFNADGTGWDGLLDDLKEAIPDYDAFLQDIIANGIAGANIPDGPADPVDPTDPLSPIDAVKSLAGEYLFTVQSTGSGSADLSGPGSTPRGLRLDTSFPECAPLGIEDDVTRWDARIVIRADASVSIQNPDNASQSIMLTPGEISSDDKTLVSRKPNYSDPDGDIYELKRTILYDDGAHQQPLQDNFSIQLSVNSQDELVSVTMWGASDSPRMDFCPVGSMAPKIDDLDALKALVGNYTLERDYRIGASGWVSPGWTTVDVSASGSMTFAGDGPSFSTSEVVTVRLNNRQNSGNYDAEGGIWGMSVILDRDINGDTFIDNNDRVNLFLTASGALRDIQYKTPNAELIEVSVIDGQLPDYDESLSAMVGNGINAKIEGTDASISATETYSNIELAGGFFAKRNGQYVPSDEQRAWRIRINDSNLQTTTPYTCTTKTSVAFDDSMGVLTSATGGGSVLPRHLSTAGGDCEIQLLSITKNDNSITTSIEGKFRTTLWDKQKKLHVPAVGYFRQAAP